METFNKLAAMIAENRGVDRGTITVATTFEEDLKIDSLDMMDMLMQVSEDFGVSTDNLKPGDIKNVGDLVKFVDGAGA